MGGSEDQTLQKEDSVLSTETHLAFYKSMWGELFEACGVKYLKPLLLFEIVLSVTTVMTAVSYITRVKLSQKNYTMV